MSESAAGVQIMTCVAPVSGRAVAITDVPDAVFAERLLGDGLAIEPDDGTVVAPVAGVVESMLDSGHALAIRTGSGAAVLVHIGIDSAQFGHHFRRLVSQGDTVAAGQEVIRFDLAGLRRDAPAVVTPVVILDPPVGAALETVAPGSRVVAGVTSVAVLRAAG